jgi:hypothetical protein
LRSDDRTIYVVLILASVLPLASALISGGRVGAGVTICFLMLAIGAIGLVSSTWRRRRRRASKRASLRS